MDPILFIATYSYIIIPVMTLIGVLIGKMLEGRTTRKELDEACSGSWTDMKKLSKEVKDVLESLEPPKV